MVGEPEGTRSPTPWTTSWNIDVKSDTPTKLKEISGNTLELEVTIKNPTAKECGLDVLCDKEDAYRVRIAYISATKILKVGNVDAPFELKPGEDLTLRVFIDKNLVEVFANDRQAALNARGGYAPDPLHPDRILPLIPRGGGVPDNLGISLFSTGGDAAVKQVKGWKMKSSYADK